MTPYLQVENLTKSFGDLALLTAYLSVLQKDSASD